jgi:hypothetical protein
MSQHVLSHPKVKKKCGNCRHRWLSAREGFVECSSPAGEADKLEDENTGVGLIDKDHDASSYACWYPRKPKHIRILKLIPPAIKR